MDLYIEKRLPVSVIINFRKYCLLVRMSILDPLTCGFVKVYCYGLVQETNTTKSSMSKIQKGELNKQI